MSSEMPRGQETVLVVEDGEDVRAFVRNVLEPPGYTVLEATSVEDAFRIGEGYAGIIHMLLTDVVMPRMSGRELAETIAAARSGTRILFTSGYTDDAIAGHGGRRPESSFLEKPFTLEALAAKVRGVLDGE